MEGQPPAEEDGRGEGREGWSRVRRGLEQRVEKLWKGMGPGGSNYPLGDFLCQGIMSVTVTKKMLNGVWKN